MEVFSVLSLFYYHKDVKLIIYIFISKQEKREKWKKQICQTRFTDEKNVDDEIENDLLQIFLDVAVVVKQKLVFWANWICLFSSKKINANWENEKNNSKYLKLRLEQ